MTSLMDTIYLGMNEKQVKNIVNPNYIFFPDYNSNSTYDLGVYDSIRLDDKKAYYSICLFYFTNKKLTGLMFKVIHDSEDSEVLFIKLSELFNLKNNSDTIIFDKKIEISFNFNSKGLNLDSGLSSTTIIFENTDFN